MSQRPWPHPWSLDRVCGIQTRTPFRLGPSEDLDKMQVLKMIFIECLKSSQNSNWTTSVFSPKFSLSHLGRQFADALKKSLSDLSHKMFKAPMRLSQNFLACSKQSY